MEEIELDSEFSKEYPERFEQGTSFYIRNKDQFRGQHFVVAYVRPALHSDDGNVRQISKLLVTDTSLNTYIFNDTGDTWTIAETNGNLTVIIDNEDIVVE
jgi:hypothetical protein